MKILLKDFQTEYVEQFVRALRKASRDARDRELQAVSLASPTGSGKTVMATAAIERILAGDGERGPDPDATFLWITDQPELNEQTRRKILDVSSVLGLSHLDVIDSTFDQETFSRGKVYFLNTQKLGGDNILVREVGDRRTFTLWETVSNTVRERPGSFYVFIDEAHRGMMQSAQERNRVQAIIQKFILGSAGEIPAVPLIVGISATPRRFEELIRTSSTRTVRKVEIEPAQVRDSGLIKEVITYWHPTEDQPADMTMLREATKAWREYVRRWQIYCAAQNEVEIRPLLLVQVQDAGGTTQPVSKTDLAAAIQAIDEEAEAPLPAMAYAHAFQEGQKLTVGGREVRYVKPSEIDGDPEVKVVFFKTSLNTGWDCPRAEAMMSFRTAQDPTAITQLVGRMVRTPLARRVGDDEHLNTVGLYLPHYNEAELKEVVKRLTGPDSEMPPTELRDGKESVTLTQAPGSEAAFAALGVIPSYTVPRSTKPNEVRRFTKLGRLLSKDGLLDNAPETAARALLDVLWEAFNRVQLTPEFRSRVEERDTLDVRVVNQLLYDEADEGMVHSLRVSPENIDDLFDAAGRKLGEGLHKVWWRERVTQDPTTKSQAKLELSVLTADADLRRRLEAEAAKGVKRWLTLYGERVKGLGEARRQAYAEIRGLATQPEETSLEFPESIEAVGADSVFIKHLYVNDSGRFPAKLNGWETAVVKAETNRADVLWWLRSVPRKPWALRIPYRYGEAWKSVYPDFLVVRTTERELMVDIIDPHAENLADGPAKLAGLAKFAEDHGGDFGRIESIIMRDGDILRLNLQEETTRKKAMQVKTAEQLERLFDAEAR